MEKKLKANNLHWSFDNKYRHWEDSSFPEEFFAYLNAVYFKESHSKQNNQLDIEYAVLPNFWNGYGGSHVEGKLTFGELKIKRLNLDNNNYKYQVFYSNGASGEDLSMEYQTKNNPIRSLTGKWSIQTKNRAGDLYKSINTKGTIITLGNKQGIELTVNEGLKFISGKLNKKESLTCNWSLFDCLGKFFAQKSKKINLLEDLEKLKLDCFLTEYEDTNIDLETGIIKCKGHILHGPGEVPSYWWVDDENRVAVMSNVFNTFVLKKYSILSKFHGNYYK